jgi:hypothetical protein
VEEEAEEEAVTIAALEPEEDRAHGEHEPGAEAEEAIAVEAEAVARVGVEAA